MSVFKPNLKISEIKIKGSLAGAEVPRVTVKNLTLKSTKSLLADCVSAFV